MPDAPKRLLVVDDERDLCDLLLLRFGKLGFEVFAEQDEAAALRLALKQPPDLILLDVKLSRGQSGITFLRKLRSFRSDDPAMQKAIRSIPVMIMTAAGSAMKPLFDAEQISDFVEKPYDPDDLKTRVLAILNSSHRLAGL